MSDLGRATERLYQSFRGYPLRPRIEGCPHCELDAVESSLHSRPLRELTWSDFGVYPFKSMTTFGDEDDFRHFLPRMFELFALDHAGSAYDVKVLFEKLRYADWDTWPRSECAAVREFVRSWLRDLEAKKTGDAEQDFALAELTAALSDHDLLASGAD